MLNIQTDTGTLSQSICQITSVTNRIRSLQGCGSTVEKELTGPPHSCDLSEHYHSHLFISMNLWVS